MPTVDAHCTPQSDFSLANCLILPDSFGNIYRGETFCAYISVLNHLKMQLHNVKG